jgi:hypothetical protein
VNSTTYTQARGTATTNAHRSPTATLMCGEYLGFLCALYVLLGMHFSAIPYELRHDYQYPPYAGGDGARSVRSVRRPSPHADPSPPGPVLRVAAASIAGAAAKPAWPPPPPPPPAEAAVPGRRSPAAEVSRRGASPGAVWGRLRQAVSQSRPGRLHVSENEF